ncbi:MAG: formate dehydrogenase subunit gamma [Lysobacterales bacterium]
MTVDREALIRDLVRQFADVPGGLLPLLHAVQKALGYVPPEVIPELADGMGLSRAEVHGVIGFYHDFHVSPGGETTIHLCRAEACQAMGSRALEAHVKARLGIDYGETTADGKYRLEPVYCLGNCSCAPSVRIDDDVHARVSPDTFDQLVEV